MTGLQRTFTAGHPDLRAGRPAGRFAGILGDRLDGDGRPVFVSGGYRVLRPGVSAAGEGLLAPRRYIERQPGDRAPRVEPVECRAVQSADSLNTWFGNAPGAAIDSRTVELAWSSDTDGYTAEVEMAAGAPRTLELGGRLTYRRGAGDRLRFASDGDLWVFIDGRLVVDLGGASAPAAAAAPAEGLAPADQTSIAPAPAASNGHGSQTVQLDHLTWLRDGGDYVVKIFCASAGASDATVRLETTAWLSPLRPDQPPAQVATVLDD